MKQSDDKVIIKIIFISILALLFAYSFDQYYIYRRQLFFLSKPVQTINNLLK